MTRRTLSLDDQLYDYYLSVSLREPSILKELRAETEKLSSAKMQIAPEEGQFLSFLINLIQAKKTIDIGVYTGYSTLIAALTMPPEGKVIGCDISTEWTNIAKKFWKKAQVEDKIELRIDSAEITLQKLLDLGEQNSFDFIFIDADKKNYDIYYELSLKLIRIGGVIAIDNVLWGGRVADVNDQDENTLAIRKLNEKIVVDERVTLSMIPIADGLTLVKRK